MKAVFVNQLCLIRDSHIEPATAPDDYRLTPATLEAMRMLATENTLVFLYAAPGEEPGHVAQNGGRGSGLEALVRQVEAGGGRVDGLIACTHEGGSCACWGNSPALLWVAASQFNLTLNDCYVLGDAKPDITAAYAVGARPLMLLGSRTIGAVLGNLPDHKDFPVAPDLIAAVNYVGIEEETKRQLGHARGPPVAPPPPDELFAAPQALPSLKVTSILAQGLQTQVRKSRVMLRDMVRWLSFFVLGAVGFSLGIAYMLTHLYRVQPFPKFVYYVTLQFIDRPLRGALFIALGAAIILLAWRSLYRTTSLELWRKRKR